ncbi:MAG: MBOAT family protein [Bacteroidales bacterium]|nr:MBOAT family protein [Bacteroidales bacterium]
MLFNSLQFLVFFPLTVLLYWILPARGHSRNWMLLIASYYFYMNWEPGYAVLIFISTITTWAGALLLERATETKRKLCLIATLTVNIGILFAYKYLNFIGAQIQALMDYMGLGIQLPEFNILLPVGISFYTFQAIGYLVDVWRGTLRAERNFFTYALFVSFFPQLVAGPIERAKNLLRQFHEQHHFNGEQLIRGLELMVFGYFMKLCIAEMVAPYVDAVFNNLPQHNGHSILLATFFFTFQIFCDFGGYSLIAIGAARCMGFSLMQNFRQPYLATSVKDFWRRWHISLSSWFSDYVYIPLGGNRVSTPRHFSNLFITFLVSGIWHGANYTFLAWGAYHGALQCAHTAKSKWIRVKRPANVFFTVLNTCITFVLVALGWIFFRANSFEDALLAFKKIIFEPGPIFNGEGKPMIFLSVLLIILLIGFEVIHELRDSRSDNPSDCNSFNHSLRTGIIITAFLLIMILLTAQFAGGRFIYFQF